MSSLEEVAARAQERHATMEMAFNNVRDTPLEPTELQWDAREPITIPVGAYDGGASHSKRQKTAEEEEERINRLLLGLEEASVALEEISDGYPEEETHQEEETVQETFQETYQEEEQEQTRGPPVPPTRIPKQMACQAPFPMPPPASSKNHGGLRATEHWRESSGRYGNRGGLRNPNVAWHTARAKAERKGPEALAEFYRTTPKPPKQNVLT